MTCISIPEEIFYPEDLDIIEISNNDNIYKTSEYVLRTEHYTDDHQIRNSINYLEFKIDVELLPLLFKKYSDIMIKNKAYYAWRLTNDRNDKGKNKKIIKGLYCKLFKITFRQFNYAKLMQKKSNPFGVIKGQILKVFDRIFVIEHFVIDEYPTRESEIFIQATERLKQP